MKWFWIIIFVWGFLHAQTLKDSASISKEADRLWEEYAKWVKGKSITETPFTDSIFDILQRSESLYLQLYDQYESEKGLEYAAENVDHIFKNLREDRRQSDFIELEETLLSNYSNSTYASRVYMMLGACYIEVGRNEEAKKRCLLALEAYQQLDTLTFRMGECYNELGILARKQGDFEEAINYYKNALHIYQKTISQDTVVRRNLVKAYNNIAVNYGRLGLYDSAIYILRKHIKNPHIRNSDRLTASFNLSENLSKNGQHQEAIDLLVALNDQKGKQDDMYYLRLGEAYLRKGQSQLAIQQLQKAIEALDSKSNIGEYLYARVYEPLGDAYFELKSYSEAITSYQNGLRYITNSSLSGHVYPTVNSLRQDPESVRLLAKKAQTIAHISDNESVYTSVVEGYLKADSLLLKIRRNQRNENSRLFTNTQAHSLYAKALAFLFHQHQEGDESAIKHAWYLMERHRANLFWEQLQGVDALSVLPESDSLVKQKEVLENSLYQLQFRIEKDSSKSSSLELSAFQVREDLEKVEQHLAKRYPQYGQLQLREISTSVEQVQNNILGQRQGLIAFLAHDTTVYCITITHRGAKFHAFDINPSHIQMLNDALSNKKVEDDHLQSLLRQTYLMLIEPLGSLPKRLIIVPDGVLHYVPFEGLITKDIETPIGWKDIPYMFNDHSISYASSASILAKLKKQEATISQPYLGFAPIHFTSERAGYSLPTLDPSKDLYTNLVNGGSQDYYFKNDQATKSQFLRVFKSGEASNIVQLFTHAYSDPNSAPLSWILFHGTSDSAKLYMNEVYSLNLNNELTVLAACETGIGRLYQGEGMMSLERGFFYAGSKSVLATSWKVDPEPTDYILSRFYHYYLTEEMPRDQALQQAKKDCFNKQSKWEVHPRNWGGLRLTGIAERIPETGFRLWGLVLLGVCGLLLVIAVLWFRQKQQP